MSTTHQILTELARPFPADAVSWRVGQVPKPREGEVPTHGRALAYIDARDCEDRLDEVAGVNWSSRHEIHLVNEKGEQGVLCVCHVSLLLETAGAGWQWVSRSNGSGETDYEGQKGAMSKAFVRAASAWGVGRFLYAMGSPKVKIVQFGKTWTIDKSEEGRLREIVQRFVRDFEANPRMRPLLHEEDAAEQQRPGAQIAPPRSVLPTETPGSSAPPAPLLRALKRIQDAVYAEDALMALSAARQDRTVDPVAAEETFARWLVSKATSAKTEETLTRIEGALRRASLGARLNRDIGETITKAKRALTGAQP